MPTPHYARLALSIRSPNHSRFILVLQALYPAASLELDVVVAVVLFITSIAWNPTPVTLTTIYEPCTDTAQHTLADDSWRVGRERHVVARTVLDLADSHCGFLREVIFLLGGGVRAVLVCFEPAPKHLKLILLMEPSTIEPNRTLVLLELKGRRMLLAKPTRVVVLICASCESVMIIMSGVCEPLQQCIDPTQLV